MHQQNKGVNQGSIKTGDGEGGPGRKQSQKPSQEKGLESNWPVMRDSGGRGTSLRAAGEIEPGGLASLVAADHTEKHSTVLVGDFTKRVPENYTEGKPLLTPE